MTPCNRSLLWAGYVSVNPVVYPLVGGDLQEQKRYLQLIGGTETGKAQLAIPLGRNAVRGCGIVDLVNPLEQEKAADKARQLANRLVVVVK